MSSNSTEVTSFFDTVGGGGAPSAKLKEINDGVIGEIVDQYIVNAKKFGTDVDEVDEKTGKPVQQLVVILQTTLRNWDGVSKTPVVDPADPKSPEKDPSDDDGKRAVYVKPGHNLHAAIGKAIIAEMGQKGPLVTGATLGVKVADLEPTRKGNPKKVHEAKYVKPSAGAAFFNGSESQGQQSQGQAATQSEPQGQDPWGGQTGQGSQPPF